MYDYIPTEQDIKNMQKEQPIITGDINADARLKHSMTLYIKHGIGGGHFLGNVVKHVETGDFKYKYKAFIYADSINKPNIERITEYVRFRLGQTLTDI
tara:strand:- start:254 stop:547 length:294 start_codon:yes stop_codon:yes gene_type:complete